MLALLFIRSRITLSLAIALTATQLAGAGLASLERAGFFPYVDLSIFSAIALPGVMVSLIMASGISQVPDLEAVARPRPTIYTLALIFALVGTSSAIAISTRLGIEGVEYSGFDIARNYLVYLALGLLPAVWRTWIVGPVLVALTTVTTMGIYGITRSTFPFGPIVGASGDPGGVAAGAVVVTGLVGVLVFRQQYKPRHSTGWIMRTLSERCPIRLSYPTLPTRKRTLRVKPSSHRLPPR